MSSAVSISLNVWASAHFRAWMRNSDPLEPAVSTRNPHTPKTR